MFLIRTKSSASRDDAKSYRAWDCRFRETDISYFPDSDTMAISVRPWPDVDARDEQTVGGEDAGEDLVIHYAADGAPWLWEIEHASRHPRTHRRRARTAE